MEAVIAKNQAKRKRRVSKETIVYLCRILVSLTLVLLGLFLVTEERYGLWANLAINLVAYIIVAYDVIFDAFKNLFTEKNPFDEDFLMVIASVGAFALRAFGPEYNSFFDAVMVMLLFQVGEMFEDLATSKGHQAIEDAVGLRAQVAHLEENGKIDDVPPESVKVGSLILVKVGEIIPSDGIIEQGEGYVDISSLTGESAPVYKKVGEEVNSGTILKRGSLTVRVSKSYEDSTVNKIVKLVEEGAAAKSKATRFVDKFSKIYTPIVVTIALLIAVIPPLVINMNDAATWQHWVYMAICLLVISCPCAIVVSVPLAYFAGLGLASKAGVVVKGAEYFDKLNELGLVVTDKTGTLTYGSFKLTGLYPAEGVSKEDLLENLRIAECESIHPLSSAILGDSDASVYAKDVSSYDEIPGLGVKAIYQGKTYLAGSEKLMKENKIAYKRSLEVGSVIYLAVDGAFMGSAVCSDDVREDSFAFVEGLHKQGIKVEMLTGDKEKSALAVTNLLGIDEYHAELLPNDKTDRLKAAIDSSGKKTVAYIGDGINDAPSLALADVGVAMGGVGSDLAIENADVVIMNDSPKGLLKVLRISKLTRNVALFNIIFALVVKVAIALCSIFVPGFPLIVAVIGDTGLTLVLAANSLTILFHKP
jgi:Cd2+/Zn2+-exporting ATPase